MSCEICKNSIAVIIRPSTRERLCKKCFIKTIDEVVHNTIIDNNMFDNYRTLIIGVSGGKDSTVLAYIINRLKHTYNYNIELKLLCIDEGIHGYRDESIKVVKQLEIEYNIPLSIISYKDNIGYTMDNIVEKIGRKNNCTYCGVFRRGLLENGSKDLDGDLIATGHNADDLAETVLMNYLRGDIHRLIRCTASTSEKTNNSIPRCKPLMNVYEKEIVMYAFYNKLPYFSTECKYSPGAFRGVARNYIKSLEKINPIIIKNIINSGHKLQIKSLNKAILSTCIKCKKQCSGELHICKSCLLIDTLNSC